MLPPIPNLVDYGLSPTYGFLPAQLPLERLPDPYYNKWEAVVANLQGLILSKRLRGVIERLPVLSTAGLEHDSEWRRAYSLLCFMAHGYIWGGDSPSEVCKCSAPIALPTADLRSASHLQSQSRCYTSPSILKCLLLPLMLLYACGISSLCSWTSMLTTSKTLPR